MATHYGYAAPAAGLSPQAPAGAQGFSTAAPQVAGSADICHWWYFAQAAALSGGAGIRATLPAFLLSLCHLLDAHEYPLSKEAEWLGREEICFLMGLLLLLEIIADQIPAVDHMLHAVLLPAHPAMGAAAAIAPDYCGGWYARAPMAVAGAGLALSVHSGKSLLRTASSGGTCTILNPLLSNCETLSATGLMVMCIISPSIAAGVFLLFLYLGYLSIQLVRQTFSSGAAAVNGEPPRRQNSQGAFPRTPPSAPPAQAAWMPRADTGGQAMEDELRVLLREDEEAGLYDQPPAAESEPEKCVEAAGEVERILAAPSPQAVLGGGTAHERKQEFRRLARLLHPDKGYVCGSRASLALRRVVEAHRTLDGSP